MSDNERWKKLAFFAAMLAQVHTVLEKLSPSYAAGIEKLQDAVLKKIRLKPSLWDDIGKFLGTTDIAIEKIEVLCKEQNGLMEIFLHENFRIAKMIRRRKSKEEIPLAEGTATLDQIDGSMYEDQPAHLGLREILTMPENLKNHGVNVYKTGYAADLITYGTYEGWPCVIQRVTTDQNKPMTLVVAHSKNDKRFNDLKKSIEHEVLEQSFLKHWICQAEIKDNYLGFSYLNEASFCLRNQPPHILSLTTEIREFIYTEIPNFVRLQSKLTTNGMGRRSYLIQGASGTGKSAIVRQIISCLPTNYTILYIGPDGVRPLSYLRNYPFLFPVAVIIENVGQVVMPIDVGSTMTLMNFLDGINSPDQCLTIMTATDSTEISDLICQRPGRVDKIIQLELPDKQRREELLTLFSSHLKFPNGETCESLVQYMEGWSIAKIREFVQRATIYSGDPIMREQKLSTEAVNRALNEMVIDTSQTDEPHLTPSEENQTEPSPDTDLR